MGPSSSDCWFEDVWEVQENAHSLCPALQHLIRDNETKFKEKNTTQTGGDIARSSCRPGSFESPFSWASQNHSQEHMTVNVSPSALHIHVAEPLRDIRWTWVSLWDPCQCPFAEPCCLCEWGELACCQASSETPRHFWALELSSPSLVCFSNMRPEDKRQISATP